MAMDRTATSGFVVKLPHRCQVPRTASRSTPAAFKFNIDRQFIDAGLRKTATVRYRRYRRRDHRITHVNCRFRHPFARVLGNATDRAGMMFAQGRAGAVRISAPTRLCRPSNLSRTRRADRIVLETLADYWNKANIKLDHRHLPSRTPQSARQSASGGLDLIERVLAAPISTPYHARNRA